MAKANSTPRLIEADTDHSAENGAMTLQAISFKLNDYAALLAGVEEICQIEDIGGDVLNVVSKVCQQINADLCKMADNLRDLDRKGGAT